MGPILKAILLEVSFVTGNAGRKEDLRCTIDAETQPEMVEGRWTLPADQILRKRNALRYVASFLQRMGFFTAHTLCSFFLQLVRKQELGCFRPLVCAHRPLLGLKEGADGARIRYGRKSS